MNKVEGVAPEQASFVYMDAFRFVAALLVVLNHVRDLLLVDYEQAAGAGVKMGPGALTKALYYLAGFGHQSVVIFFVLSGFWITKTVVRRDAQPRFWTEYLIDRLSRLGIVLVPVLLAGGMLDMVGSTLIAPAFYHGASGAHSMPAVADTLSWRSFGANLVFLQSLVAPPFGSNGPLWSLAYEFWYYLWFPALWMLRRRRVSLALLTLALGWAYPDVADGFLSWLCGSVLYFACARGKQMRWIGRRGLAWPCLVVGAAILLTALGLSRVSPLLPFGGLAISAGFALFLFGLFLYVPPQWRVLGPVARYGAQSSFSLYSLHYPLAALIVALIAPVQRLQPNVGAVALLIVVIGVIVGAGALFSRVTERHTSALRKRLRRTLLPQLST